MTFHVEIKQPNDTLYTHYCTYKNMTQQRVFALLKEKIGEFDAQPSGINKNVTYIYPVVNTGTVIKLIHVN